MYQFSFSWAQIPIVIWNCCCCCCCKWTATSNDNLSHVRWATTESMIELTIHTTFDFKLDLSRARKAPKVYYFFCSYSSIKSSCQKYSRFIANILRFFLFAQCNLLHYDYIFLAINEGISFQCGWTENSCIVYHRAPIMTPMNMINTAFFNWFK